jgi:hypothetical protein
LLNFFFVPDKEAFSPGKLFQPKLIMAMKARACLSGAPFPICQAVDLTRKYYTSLERLARYFIGH